MKSGHRVTSQLVLMIALLCPAEAGQFTIPRVADNATVYAKGHDIEVVIELVGVDVPTSSTKEGGVRSYAQQAIGYLKALVLNKTVDIKGYGTTPHGRVLGEITQNGKNINLEMVKAGFAKVRRGVSPEGFDLTPYRQAEEEAMGASLGIWQQGAPSTGSKQGFEQRRGLASWPDWCIGGLAILVFLVFLIAICFEPIYDWVKANKPLLVRRLPMPGEIATLLGLVLATIAVVADLSEENAVANLHAPIMFLIGTAFFLFLYIFCVPFHTWQPLYVAAAAITSSWYCLAWSMFALLDVVVLPDWGWRYALAVAPILMLFYALIGQVVIYRTARRARTQDRPTCLPEGD